MKKLLLITAILASFGASAAVVDNDVNQGAIADLQVNGMLDASLLSIGNTNVTGTNLVNTSTATTLGFTAAIDNDVNQGALFIGQGNGVLSINGADLGNTNVTGVNSVNYSTQTAGAAGLLAITSENDTNQGAAFILQGNGVANGALVSVGNIRVDGTNLVNTSTQNIGGLGIVTGVEGNDITQGATIIGQGNGVLDVALGKAGNISVTGLNSVNGATQNIGSIGLLADGVVDNDITQNATEIGQTNGVTTGAIVNLGNVIVEGTNLVNTAEKNTFAGGILQLVIGNDITQTANDINQSNTVTSVSGIKLGNIAVNGVNAVNVADAELAALAGLQIVADNKVEQVAYAIRQDNEILVGAVLSGGNLNVNGTNVVNQASHSIDAFALGGGVFENDVNQGASDIVQANRIGVVAGANVGAVNVIGNNAVNTATLDIDFGVLGLAAGNDINQGASGIVQYNAVGSVAAVQAGPMTVTGTNSINAANLSVIQGTP